MFIKVFVKTLWLCARVFALKTGMNKGFSEGFLFFCENPMKTLKNEAQIKDFQYFKETPRFSQGFS